VFFQQLTKMAKEILNFSGLGCVNECVNKRTDMDQYGQTGGNDMRVRGDHTAAGNIRLSEIPASFARQIKWMVPLLLVLALLSFWFTKDIKRQYIADGRLLVLLGSDYVYNPVTGVGNVGSPLTITPDQVVLTEIGIIKNSAIMDQVINKMIASPANGGVGGERFAPKLYEKWVKASAQDKVNHWNDLVKSVDMSYAVIPRPKSSIVDLVYKHPDGEVAVKTLDALMTAYGNFRKEKFVNAKTPLVEKRRIDTQEQLATIEAKIQNTLNKNGISDFGSEQIGVQTRAEALRAQINTLVGGLAAAEAALAASEDQLRRLPQTIDLYVEDRASQRLAQAELEKRQLLAKYLPTSNPVRAKEAEISQLKAQISSYGGKPNGGRRVGPNPVYQTLLTQRNTYQANADSLREQEIALQKQLIAVNAKVKRMRQLAPAYANLVREKTIIEARLEGLQARETEALVNEKQIDSSDNIKFITRPTIPRKGRNMKKVMFALGVMASVFSVLMLALLRVFLDPRIYGPGPNARQRQGSGYGLDQGYYDNVPEAVPYVPPYVQEAAPMPAYMPAAYNPEQAQGQAYGQDQAYGDPYGSQANMQPHLQPHLQHHMGASAQPFDEQIYADGSYGGVNPYVGAPAQTYPDQTYSAQAYSSQAYPAQIYSDPLEDGQVEYAGPDNNIPVLGNTTKET